MSAWIELIATLFIGVPIAGLLIVTVGYILGKWAWDQETPWWHKYLAFGFVGLVAFYSVQHF